MEKGTIESMCTHITNDSYRLSFKHKNSLVEAIVDKENLRKILTNLDNELK